MNGDVAWTRWRATPASFASLRFVSNTISLLHVSDPGCPWAYSAAPASRGTPMALWRAARLAPRADRPRRVGRRLRRPRLRPGSGARGYLRFREYGMPFDTQPRERKSAPAARAARSWRRGSAHPRPRSRRSARCSSPASRRRRCSTTDEGHPRRARTGSAPRTRSWPRSTTRRHERGLPGRPRRGPQPRAGARPSSRARQRTRDGAVRYTAPSLIFTHRDGRRLEAGGYQPVEAYDVVIANLDPTLERRPPAEDVTELLARVPVRADHARGGRRDGPAPRRARRAKRPRPR